MYQRWMLMIESYINRTYRTCNVFTAGTTLCIVRRDKWPWNMVSTEVPIFQPSEPRNLARSIDVSSVVWEREQLSTRAPVYRIMPKLTRKKPVRVGEKEKANGESCLCQILFRSMKIDRNCKHCFTIRFNISICVCEIIRKQTSFKR